MKVFRRLEIGGASEILEKLMDKVVAILREPWSFAREEVGKSLSRDGNKNQRWCFRRLRTASVPNVLVWIYESLPDQLRLTNIVPDAKTGQISMDEYNSIVEELSAKYIVPCSHALEVTVTLTKPDESPDDWLSASSSQLLRRFLSRGNSSSPLAHPSDEDRWEEFIVEAHNEQSALDGHTLRRWLCEDGHLPYAVALELVSKYELGRSVLSRAQTRVGV